jgi:rod shape-determining protein MreC
MALYGRARRTRLVVVSLVMASLVTITVDYRGGEAGPLAAAGRAALSVVGALQDGVSRVLDPVASWFSGIVRVGSLKEENERLRQQVRELQQERARLMAIELENRQLRDLLDLRGSLGFRGVTARVVGESVSNFEWSVTIDAGSSDGVRKDMAVLSGEGLVGRVVEVAPNTSVVQLIIDPDSAVAARLVNSGETGLVEGNRNQDLRMELVNPDVEVLPDEQVVTSGYQGGLYPPGILIGYVSHVLSQPGMLTKLVAVRPAVDFSSLSFVLVVTGR